MISLAGLIGDCAVLVIVGWVCAGVVVLIDKLGKVQPIRPVSDVSCEHQCEHLS